jgi:hypothetical protein
LIFADITQSPALRYWEFSSPFFFEVVDETRGRRDSSPLLRAMYENEQLQLPEELRLNIRRHGICPDPDSLHLEASEDECPTVLVDAYIEWAALAEYVSNISQ